MLDNKDKNVFGINLENELKKQGYTQKELADNVLANPATVSSWIKGRRLPRIYDLTRVCLFLNVSSDKLLGIALQSNEEKNYSGIKWIEHSIPQYFPHKQREQIKHGIEFFKEVMIEGFSEKNYYEGDMPLQLLLKCFIVTVRSHILQITDIERDIDKETKIKELNPTLRKVLVAKLPKTQKGTDIDYLCGHIIKTEMISFLGATQAFTDLPGKNIAIGIGSGYSVSRFAEKTSPDAELFSGTRWVPLMVAEDRDRGFTVHSANDIAALLSIRHPGSRHIHRTFNDQDGIKHHINEMKSIFLGVISFDNTIIDNFPALHMDFHTYGDTPPKLIGEVYEYLQKEGVRKPSILLGSVIDDKGNEVVLPDLKRLIEKNISSLTLSSLREKNPLMPIWLLAAGKHKSVAVRSAIRSKAINSLIIDSDIADNLISQDD